MFGGSWAVSELLGWGIWGTCLVKPGVWSGAGQWRLCMETCMWCSTHVGVTGQLGELSALLPFWLQDGTQISSLAIRTFTCHLASPPILKHFSSSELFGELDKMQNLRLLLKVCLARPLIPLLQHLEPHIRALDLEQSEQIEKQAETGVDLMPGNLRCFWTGSAELCMLVHFSAWCSQLWERLTHLYSFTPGLCSTSCSSVTHSCVCLSLSPVQSLLPNWWWQELPPSCVHLWPLAFFSCLALSPLFWDVIMLALRSTKVVNYCWSLISPGDSKLWGTRKTLNSSCICKLLYSSMVLQLWWFFTFNFFILCIIVVDTRVLVGACHSTCVEVRGQLLGISFLFLPWDLGNEAQSSGQVLFTCWGVSESPGFCFKPHGVNRIKDLICRLKSTSEGFFIGLSKSFTWARRPWLLWRQVNSKCRFT